MHDSVEAESPSATGGAAVAACEVAESVDPKRLDRALIDAPDPLVAPLGVLTDAELLTGGQFATTYRVTLTDGGASSSKTAPTRTDQLLAYEHDLLRAEALVYEVAASVTRAEDAAGAAHRLHADRCCPATRSWSATCRACHWSTRGSGRPDPRTARPSAAPVRCSPPCTPSTGPRVGYPCGRQASSWAESFTGMIDELSTTPRAAVGARPPTRLRGHVPARARARRRRPTGLVHTDLWAGNLFVDPATGELLGVIDPERAFWGDPLADLSASTPWAASPGRPPCSRATGRWTSSSPSRTRLDASTGCGSAS